MGVRIMIVGIKAQPKLNGTYGTIEKYNAQLDRWTTNAWSEGKLKSL